MDISRATWYLTLINLFDGYQLKFKIAYENLPAYIFILNLLFTYNFAYAFGYKLQR